MEFVCKKTTELSKEDLHKIGSLFSEVFNQVRTEEVLLNQYLNNAFGTSYHVLMYDDGQLIGHNAGVPGYLMINGKKVPALNNVDLMIKEEKRGLQGFMMLVKTAWAFYKEQGIQLIYSLPNNNSHPLLVKLKFVNDIGRLYTYCLPYRIGGVKKGLAFANFLSKRLCKLWVLCSSILASEEVTTFRIQRDYESFKRSRYKRSDGQYSFGEFKGSEFVYKIMVHEGVRTAFIIDVYDKSKMAFCRAVNYLLKNESNNFDLILYVGNLPFANIGLFRVPHKYEPKQFNFVGHVLNSEGLDDKDKNDYMDINRWDINLADDDII